MRPIPTIVATPVATALCLLGSVPAGAQGLTPEQGPKTGTPDELVEVQVNEQLGEPIPLDLMVTDHRGQRVALKSYFEDGKPVILNLGYYACPMLCSMVLNGLVKGLNKVNWAPGEQFRVLTLSIDPKEDASLAAAKRANYMQTYAQGAKVSDDAWPFLVADEATVKKLSEESGFGFRWDERQQQYAHAAVIMILTPEGRLSRYLYGIEFSPKDLKLGLLEASEGRIGNAVEQLLLYCYHYDPVGKKYALFARNLMKLGGAITVLVLGAVLALFWLAEKRRGRGGDAGHQPQPISSLVRTGDNPGEING